MNVHDFIEYRLEKIAAEDSSTKSKAVKPVLSGKGAGVKMKDLSFTANPVGKVSPVSSMHKKSTGVAINKKIAPNVYLSAHGKTYKKYSGKYPTGKKGTYAGLKISGSF